MDKDFIRWHNIKRSVQNAPGRAHFKEREIWFCHLGENVGYEQDGRGEEYLRPVLIIKKFNNELFWSVPLTKHIKQGHPYYYNFSFRADTKSSAILSQLRLLDAKRLRYKVGHISNNGFEALKTQIRQLLA